MVQSNSPLNGLRLIVAPFHLPWEWSADYANQTCYVLAKKDVVIAYLWADTTTLKRSLVEKKLPTLLKKHSPNLYSYTPLYIFPFRRFAAIERLNIITNLLVLKIIALILTLVRKPSEFLLWNFFPVPEFLKNPLGARYKVLYDCADFFPGTAKNATEKDLILKNEKLLTKRADIVYANSMVLQKHLKKWRSKVILVPQGFRVQDFEKRSNYKSPKIKAKKPIIGFAGAVNHRIDYDILLPLAKNNPQWSFVIWGPVLDKERVTPEIWKKMDKLLALKNVSTGFLQDRTKLPGIFKQFDITMIPYDIKQEFNKYCYPMKLFEFFYLGKPVVSTDVVELRRFPKFVKISQSLDGWQKILNKLTSGKWPKKFMAEERKLAYENSWENKVAIILSHIN